MVYIIDMVIKLVAQCTPAGKMISQGAGKIMELLFMLVLSWYKKDYLYLIRLIMTFMTEWLLWMYLAIYMMYSKISALAFFILFSCFFSKVYLSLMYFVHSVSPFCWNVSSMRQDITGPTLGAPWTVNQTTKKRSSYFFFSFPCPWLILEVYEHVF